MGDMSDEHSVAVQKSYLQLPWCVIILTVTEKYEFGIFPSRYVFNLKN